MVVVVSTLVFSLALGLPIGPRWYIPWWFVVFFLWAFQQLCQAGWTKVHVSLANHVEPWPLNDAFTVANAVTLLAFYYGSMTRSWCYGLHYSVWLLLRRTGVGAALFPWFWFSVSFVTHSLEIQNPSMSSKGSKWSHTLGGSYSFVCTCNPPVDCVPHWVSETWPMLFQPLLQGRNVWNKTSAIKQLIPSLSILGEQIGAHLLDVAPTATPTKIFLELVRKVLNITTQCYSGLCSLRPLQFPSSFAGGPSSLLQHAKVVAAFVKS